MKIVALIPIKLHSLRLPNKNILPIAGHPLCWHVCNSLLCVRGIDDIYVFCSEEKIIQFLPDKIKFKKRDSILDGDLIKGYQIYESFINEIEADIYIIAHTTSPFIKSSSIENALKHVISGEYDSAFAAERFQTFAWYKGTTLNYDLNDVPRTQDITPVWIETSAFYIFRKEIFTIHNRRIGFKPYIQEVCGLEATDIDEKKDYDLACKLARIEGME